MNGHDHLTLMKPDVRHMNREGTRTNAKAKTTPDMGVLAWLPLLLSFVPVWQLRSKLPPWAFMWTLAVLIFMGCKWVTWQGCAGKALKPWQELGLSVWLAGVGCQGLFM